MCAASLRGEVSAYPPPPLPHPLIPRPLIPRPLIPRSLIPRPSPPVPSSPVPPALLLQLGGISGGRLLARPCAWPKVLTRAVRDGRYRHARLRIVPLRNAPLPANAGRGVRGGQAFHGRLVEIDCEVGEIARDRARSREIARAGARAGDTWQIGVSGGARDGARWQSAAISAHEMGRDVNQLEEHAPLCAQSVPGGKEPQLR